MGSFIFHRAKGQVHVKVVHGEHATWSYKMVHVQHDTGMILTMGSRKKTHFGFLLERNVMCTQNDSVKLHIVQQKSFHESWQWQIWHKAEQI